VKITDIFNEQPRTFSFEFFPPRDEISAVDFGINIGQLLKLRPSFITVTYGAGGSTRERTFSLVNYLQNKIGMPTMAHYTCVDASRKKIDTDIKQLEDIGIENLMLLRGDPPGNEKKFIPHPEGFQYASELIAHVKDMGDFCIGGAAYPEKHPESPDIQSDLTNLLTKVKAGADFLVTQFFFSNDAYFSFVKKARKLGIQKRIIPGIIPITNYNQIKKFLSLSAATLPDELKQDLEKNKNNPSSIYRLGVEYTIAQCHDLLERGAPGIHFYTLNKSRASVEIFETLKYDYIT
jgi:methylenetetrahydrofolate reductase (NADPH)